jgi:hypothetical protein
MSVVGSNVEHVFDPLPADAAELRGLDDAALIDAIAGWAHVSAAADARKYAAIAELERRRCTDEHPNWACDDWDAAAAEVAAALNTGHGRASGEMDMATMLRDRFPLVGALFLAGELSARRVWIISNRTYLVTDARALAELDKVIAERITTWGPLSEYKLAQAIDVWVDKIDPGALRRTRNDARTRDFTVADGNGTGTAAVYGRLFATDAALLKQRLAAMARSVCEDDPRTLRQRRADALGALAAGSDHLACRCDNPDCPTAVDDGRASSVVVHVIAEQATAEAQPDPQMNGDGLAPDETPDSAVRRKAALIAGGGPVPAPLLGELIARGAKVKLVGGPGHDPEPQYRPSKALDEFVRVRDMTCRFPGCDRPAVFGDVDHTVAHPSGPTHAGNLKCYCRKHHLVKTFWRGWSDRQLADGTVVVTAPTGHTYATKPGSSLFFPSWAISTPVPPGRSATPGEYRAMMMPARKRSRVKARADRRKRECALNDAYVAERNRPPPFSVG